MAAALPMILMGAGTAMSVFGQIQQAKSEKRAYEFNAQQAAREAAWMREQTAQAASDKQREKVRMLSAQRARAAASGLDLSGSPLDVLLETVTEYDTDISRILRGGEYNVQSKLQESALNQSRAKSAMQGGLMSAGSTLLTGAYTGIKDYKTLKLGK